MQKPIGIPHDIPMIKHDKDTEEYLRIAKEIMMENPRLFRAFASGKIDQ